MDQKLETIHIKYISDHMTGVSESSFSFVSYNHPPPPRSMCGRYASYWNAFLFGIILEFLFGCTFGMTLVLMFTQQVLVTSTDYFYRQCRSKLMI